MEETPTSTPGNESQKTVIDTKDELDRVDIDLDDNNPSINTAPSRPFAKRKESRDSSLVWEHFTKVEGLPADSAKAACNYCGRPFLELFYEATIQFSGSSYVTANIYFQEICIIQENIYNLCESGNHILKNMATSMKRKYDKYWGISSKMNMLLFVAVVLDPRYKLTTLELWFKQNYPTEEGDVMFAFVKNVFDRLCAEYTDKFGTVEPTPQASRPTHKVGEGNQTRRLKLAHILERLEESTSTGDGKSEVEQYLTDGREARTEEFNILHWWKSNASKYPILARMARDVMAIPISTVSSESAFSTGGRVLDSYRSSLAPRTVEALICAQNWIGEDSIAESNVDYELVENVEKYEEEAVEILGPSKKRAVDD